MASIFTGVAFLSAWFAFIAGSTTVYYLEEECGLSVTFSNDVRLKLTHHSSSSLFYNWQCSVTFKTSVHGNNLLVQYRSMDTRRSNNCRRNSLKLLDSDRSKVLNGRYGDCGGMPHVSTYNSSGNSITFKFQTDNSFVSQHGQFDILITSYRMGYNNTCPYGGFHCINNHCINTDLVCNGFNDCGDDSDETCVLTAGAIVGIVIGVLVIVSFCVVLGVMQSRRRRRYRRLCEAKPYDVCQTTTMTYPPPPTYSSVQNPYPQPSYQSYGR